MPNPRVPDWRASDVLWYPAKFIKRYERSAKTNREYKFEWLDCNNYSVHEPDDSVASFLLVQTYYQSHAYCPEIMDITLTLEKVGKIRLPFFMNPSDRVVHENPHLSAIFEWAVTPLSLILAHFEDSHPVIKKVSVDWLGCFHLYPTPELECLILTAQQRLIIHPNLAELPGFERNEHICGVGSALLQILAIQDQLGEPLNLNSDTIHDLMDSSQGQKALVRFNADHVTYDWMLRPPIFCHVKPSGTKPMEPIFLDSEGSKSELSQSGKWKPIGDAVDEKPTKKRKLGGEKAAAKKSKKSDAVKGKCPAQKAGKSKKGAGDRPQPQRSNRLR
ncbi:hypothetical protein B0H10DRAFT_1965317 [Mycena sp. CBHHK59/15]|nr:hypothetical protein B0H10DRAFT_1965317 [Mycena sp. CBHHK59/15]